MKDIAILGAGSWGTALGVSLSANGHQVRLWGRDENKLREMAASRENRHYLPGVSLPAGLRPTYSRQEALAAAEIAVFAVPAQRFRAALTEASPYLRAGQIIINAAKGIEQNSLKRLSEVAAQVFPAGRYVALSGPSHAEEVGLGLPTTLVAAAGDRALAEIAQDALMSENLRVYTSTDIIGVELGGALKNIIALGAGIADGLGFGDNTKAAMMTRGLAEISRLGLALGAQENTFFGLTGIGDLIVTCTSVHSRNRRCGILIGEGVPPAAAAERVGMVVEGMFTTAAAYELAARERVAMPITEHIRAVLLGETTPRAAVSSLMTRGRKHEREEETLRG
ncbi:MAG: NAD(P)H-dependent glycerol-3-phosphate dehydrogenase [Peptococcaceae bacterium]|nr:NAD(P)H-dependent glycerol-3-phosphate dehydrogenase [Peptococcaceae bacterium]